MIESLTILVANLFTLAVCVYATIFIISLSFKNPAAARRSLRFPWHMLSAIVSSVLKLLFSLLFIIPLRILNGLRRHTER